MTWSWPARVGHPEERARAAGVRVEPWAFRRSVPGGPRTPPSPASGWAPGGPRSRSPCGLDRSAGNAFYVGATAPGRKAGRLPPERRALAVEVPLLPAGDRGQPGHRPGDRGRRCRHPPGPRRLRGRPPPAATARRTRGLGGPRRAGRSAGGGQRGGPHRSQGPPHPAGGDGYRQALPARSASRDRRRRKLRSALEARARSLGLPSRDLRGLPRRSRPADPTFTVFCPRTWRAGDQPARRHGLRSAHCGHGCGGIPERWWRGDRSPGAPGIRKLAEARSRS